MHYIPGDAEPGLKRNPFKAIVAPRPIGWITTLNSDGGINLAPYSFFNGVSEEPPCIMYSSSPSSSGTSKDTLANVERTGEFVVNLATSELRDHVRRSGVALERGESEIEMVGLEPAPSLRVETPRVAAAPASLECRLLRTVKIPDRPDARGAVVAFGEVVAMYIDERVLADGLVDPAKVKPLCRLGYNHYGVVENVFAMNVSQ